VSTEVQPQAGGYPIALEIIPERALITCEDHEAAVRRVAEAQVSVEFRPAERHGGDGERRCRITVEEGGDVVVMIADVIFVGQTTVGLEADAPIRAHVDADHGIRAPDLDAVDSQVGRARTSFGKGIDAAIGPVEANEWTGGE